MRLTTGRSTELKRIRVDLAEAATRTHHVGVRHHELAGQREALRLELLENEVIATVLKQLFAQVLWRVQVLARRVLSLAFTLKHEQKNSDESQKLLLLRLHQIFMARSAALTKKRLVRVRDCLRSCGLRSEMKHSQTTAPTYRNRSNRNQLKQTVN